MKDSNVHSTLFFKYLRATWHINLLFFVIIFIHFLLLFILPGNRRPVTDVMWIFCQLMQIAVVVPAFFKSKDYIKRAWLTVIIYALLTLTGILLRSYNDLVLHFYNKADFTSFFFDAGKIILIIALTLFSQSGESSFKIRRQLNLLGLIVITVIVISYIDSYSPASDAIVFKSLLRATLSGVINICAIIIGIGIYWMSIWKKDIKRKTIFVFIVASTCISFILNYHYSAKRVFFGEWFTGGFTDLLGTAGILLIGLAAWHEVNIKDQPWKGYGYNLFYVSRVERIIPAMTLSAMFAVLFLNLSRLDSVIIGNLIFFMIPYLVFLIFFELYSYRSEDAVLSVLSVSPIGVQITDRKFRKTYFINTSLCDILKTTEVPPDLITGNKIPQVVKSKIEDYIAREKTVDNLETELLRPDGTKFNAQCRIIPAKYYSYEIAITWIWDITDRKKYEGVILQQKYSAEIASHYKSELLNNLSNRMQSGYATMKPSSEGWPDLILTGMNKRVLELFNFNEDLNGKYFTEVFPMPDPVLVAQFFEVLNSGVSIKRELYVRRAFKFFTMLIFKASDDEVACLIDDITESKRKEKELEERERELSTLLGNLPGMVYRCKNDKKWTMFFVSQGSLELCGYKPEELIEGGSITWYDLIYPDDREKVWLDGQDALKKKESFYLDYRIITRDLAVKHVWEKGLGIFDENDELLFLEGFIFDITKQKYAEAVLRESEMKEKEIEKARALKQMAGGIAHDLNNRLMGISSYTSLIDMKVKELNIKKYTDGIQDSIRKSTELIENLLIFARQSDVVTDIFSINTMLREMTLKAAAEFYSCINIKSEFLADSDNVKGDYRQIYKAVSDIVSNGVDAMPDGGEISIITENKTIDNIMLADLNEGDSRKLFIVIKISDSGLGIEKENLSRIFDPFYTTKPVGKGKGLGLSAVYGTIQAHKGAITVDSVPGMGTSFCIYLPVE